MKWKKIAKDTKQPRKGKYPDWKPLIAKEGYYQCVYCAIHESSFGGFRNFHVEHYRPKSKFKKLLNDINNLYYACAICNTFKSDDWPAEPKKDLSNCSYPNPSMTDYNELFMHSGTGGALTANYVASKYILEKLYLNRPQLIMERRLYFISTRLQRLVTSIKQSIPNLADIETEEARRHLAALAGALATIVGMEEKLRVLRPYDSDDIKKVKS